MPQAGLPAPWAPRIEQGRNQTDLLMHDLESHGGKYLNSYSCENALKEIKGVTRVCDGGCDLLGRNNKCPRELC